jgi:TP901 family phage tail tape measure protein
MARMFEIAFQLAGKINSSFGNAFASAESKLQKMNQQISSLKAEIRELERAQKAGKISAEEFAASYSKLTEQLQKTERAQKNLARAVNLQQRVADFRGRMRAGMLGAVETAVTVGAPVKAAIDFESAMADVRKVVDFETPQQFAAMGKDILTLSTRIPMAANGLAQIVAAGGQAGIAREELLGFAESAAKMGVAFDITAEEAGQMMAEWRSAFKMNQEQVNTLADQINYLGNTTAASAPKISEVVRRIGPLGEVGGAAAGEIAALGATMVSAGITEEIAATGIKNLILGLVAGESATKSQAEAFAALGLNAKSMAKMMQKDAQGAILKVLQALQKLPEYKRTAVLSDLFGKESIGAIAPLLTNLDALKENFKKVGDATQYAGSMQKEFEARAATTENSLILLKNRIAALGISLGNIMLPYVNDISKKLAVATEWIQKLSEKHPGLTRAIVLGTAAVLGFSVALTGLGYVASIIISPFVSLYSWIIKYTVATEADEIATKKATAAQNAWNLAKKAGQGLLNVGRLTVYYTKTLAIAAATKAWTAAQWLWNAAMKAGSGLLSVGQIVLYYTKMLAITAATKAWTAAQWLWNMAMSAGKGLLSVGQLALYHAKVLAITVATKAWTAAQWLWNAAMSANPIGLVILGIGALIGAGYLLIKNWDKVKNWFITLWNDPLAALNQFVASIREKFAGIFGWLEKGWNKLTSLFGGGKKKATVELSTDALPGHAEGGIFNKPHIAWFAENGAEAAIPLDGSSRAKSIWAKAGEMLGVNPTGGASIMYAPVYNIYGERDVEKQVRRAAKSAEDDFAARFKAYLRQERRLSYA